jgi:hypothetical protein
MHSFVRRRGLEESIGHGTWFTRDVCTLEGYKLAANDPVGEYNSTGVHVQIDTSLLSNESKAIKYFNNDISSLETSLEQIVSAGWIFCSLYHVGNVGVLLYSSQC